MKNNLYIAVLLLLAGFFVACEKDTEPFEGPYRLTMGGPGAVRPESTHAYTLGDINNPDTYTWTVEGPAEIVGNNTGATVSVQFNAIGDVVLQVTNGRDARTKNVAVTALAPGQTFSLASSVNDPGVLRSGETDTLFLSFNQSLANNPTVSLITADTAFVSGTLGTVEKMNGMEYYVLYTAGEGNGTPTVHVSGIEANEAFGGATMANQVVNLHRVDNVAPVADIAYSQEAAKEGSEVTMTVTFNEPVTFTNPEDKALYIMVSGAGVTAETDTLMPTDDPRVYTFDYTVTGEGDGRLNVELDNVSDLAGNALSAVNNANGLTIDNDAPTVAGTATDNGTSATVTITSTESGTGMYLIRDASQAAPTSVDDYMSMSGAASGSVDVEAGRPASVQVALGTGRYTVYYLAMDQAGNYSPITSSNLVMD